MQCCNTVVGDPPSPHHHASVHNAPQATETGHGKALTAQPHILQQGQAAEIQAGHQLDTTPLPRNGPTSARAPMQKVSHVIPKTPTRSPPAQGHCPHTTSHCNPNTDPSLNMLLKPKGGALARAHCPKPKPEPILPRRCHRSECSKPHSPKGPDKTHCSQRPVRGTQ